MTTDDTTTDDTAAGQVTAGQVTADGMDIEVEAQPDRNRFEVVVGGEHAGQAEYRDQAGSRTFTHTEVDGPYGGRGVGSHLVQVALDATRDDGLAVVAQCSFVAEFIREHPGYQDLVRP